MKFLLLLGVDFGQADFGTCASQGQSGQDVLAAALFAILFHFLLLFFFLLLVFQLVLGPEDLRVEVGLIRGLLDFGDPDFLELCNDVRGHALSLEGLGGSLQHLQSRKIWDTFHQVR